MSVEMMEDLLDASFLLWNPHSGEKLRHLSEADSSFLSQNSSEDELTWPSLRAAQGRAANTELCYTQLCIRKQRKRKTILGQEQIPGTQFLPGGI